MQAPSWTDFLQCSVCTNRYNTTSLLPISLSCGHTICKKCLTEFMAKVCPYDKTAISPNAELLPPNSALLWLLGDGEGEEGESCELGDFSLLGLTPEDLEHFKSSRGSIKKAAMYLQPLAEPGSSQVIHYLTRPMLKKLVTVVSCQFQEADGRARVLRAARSITDRTVTELLVMHQNQQQISTLLWSAIRSRGCQFLGPVMQEEALKLILKVLEGGAFLSRKNIVLYVVQQLQQQEFHQASKTSVGHVVQLLYRASCFNVSSLLDCFSFTYHSPLSPPVCVCASRPFVWFGTMFVCTFLPFPALSSCHGSQCVGCGVYTYRIWCRSLVHTALWPLFEVLPNKPSPIKWFIHHTLTSPLTLSL